MPVLQGRIIHRLDNSCFRPHNSVTLLIPTVEKEGIKRYAEPDFSLFWKKTHYRLIQIIKSLY